jgi:hypothetical protein
MKFGVRIALKLTYKLLEVQKNLQELRSLYPQKRVREWVAEGERKVGKAGEVREKREKEGKGKGFAPHPGPTPGSASAYGY